jgi:hypothetical protein
MSFVTEIGYAIVNAPLRRDAKISSESIGRRIIFG